MIYLKKLYAEIRKWENLRGISRPMLLRLMKLYIGMDVDRFVSPAGVYSCNDFNRMAMALGCREPRKMIDFAVESGSFAVGRCGSCNSNSYGVVWIASPMFFNEDAMAAAMAKTERVESVGTDRFWSPKLDSKNGLLLSIINNTGLSNIILSGGFPAKAGSVSRGDTGEMIPEDAAETGSGERCTAGTAATDGEQVTAAAGRRECVAAYLDGVVADGTATRSLVWNMLCAADPALRDISGNGEGEEAGRLCRKMMLGEPAGHFIRHFDKFAATDNEGRTAWLHNLLRTGAAARWMRTAAAAYRKDGGDGEQPAEETAAAVVREHPNGCHEYCYPGDPQRFYLGPDGETPIPESAPPRGSDDVRWNSFRKCWVAADGPHKAQTPDNKPKLKKP